MSLAIILQFVFEICPLLPILIEFGTLGSNVDADTVVGRSGDLIVLAFISSAASALEMFSCFFHLVRRFWNHILT